MTVKQFALRDELWPQIAKAIEGFLPEPAAGQLLRQIAELPVRPSRATRSLGGYVSKSGLPVSIRLQFAQEPDSLRETFLHELAHLCDHLCNQPGKVYRRAHGPHWRDWAKRLGSAAQRCGRSAALEKLYQQRLKPVAICQTCGTEFQRTRRLNRRKNYFHSSCGGRLRHI